MGMSMLLTACSKEGAPSSESSETSTSETEIQAPIKSAKVTIEGTKFMVDGKELWINGVNTPWQKWNDFCGNMDEQSWEETFALLKKDNINCTRIWGDAD